MAKELLFAVEKNQTEDIRVHRWDYMGIPYIDIRAYAKSTGDETPIPTKKGITLTDSQLYCIITELYKVVHGEVFQTG